MKRNFSITSYIRNSSFIIATTTLALVIVSILYFYSPELANAQQPNITRMGIFNSTQSDISGITHWINSGNWSLTRSPTVVFTLNATINMVRPDGSENHEHRVSNLIIPYAPINQTNSTIIKGTTTITMRENIVNDVPTTITLSGKDISIYFDPEKIDNHFGNQSITGLVTRQTPAE